MKSVSVGTIETGDKETFNDGQDSYNSRAFVKDGGGRRGIFVKDGGGRRGIIHFQMEGGKVIRVQDDYTPESFLKPFERNLRRFGSDLYEDFKEPLKALGHLLSGSILYISGRALSFVHGKWDQGGETVLKIFGKTYPHIDPATHTFKSYFDMMREEGWNNVFTPKSAGEMLVPLAVVAGAYAFASKKINYGKPLSYRLKKCYKTIRNK